MHGSLWIYTHNRVYIHLTGVLCMEILSSRTTEHSEQTQVSPALRNQSQDPARTHHSRTAMPINFGAPSSLKYFMGGCQGISAPKSCLLWLEITVNHSSHAPWKETALPNMLRYITSMETRGQ